MLAINASDRQRSKPQATQLYSQPFGWREDWRLAILTTVGSWLILACTAPGIPIVWDEGDYLFRADHVVAWFRLLFDMANPHGGLNALSSAVIGEHWLFINWSEGHPAWFAMPIALSKALFSGALNPLTAARLGPITVFSLACGAVAFRLKREYGTTAAVVAPIALLTLPRMFSDAHFAAQDGQLAAWWLLLWVVDSSVQRGPRTTIAVGVLLGLTCATKFTGWFAVLPVILSRAITRDHQQRRELLVILPVALLIFCTVNPPLWHAPLAGLVDHFRLNLGRPDIHFPGTRASDLPGVWAGRQRLPFNLRDYALGSMQYDKVRYAPWYNTIAWLVLVTPLPTLALGLIGLRHAHRHALLVHWATLMVVRALPGSPANDGIRYMLPAFGFWCVFAGIGAQRLWKPAFGFHAVWRGRVIRGAIVAALGAAAFNVARYYPQTLSHYSLLVGGVRGAASIGMEPTYWWDALDDDVLGWLNSHAEPGAAVAFSMTSDTNLALLREWGRLRTNVTDPSWGTIFKWYVLQNWRLSAADRELIRSYTPAYAKYVGRHGKHVPPDLKVPLILIFSYDQYKRAVLSSDRE